MTHETETQINRVTMEVAFVVCCQGHPWLRQWDQEELPQSLEEYSHFGILILDPHLPELCNRKPCEQGQLVPLPAASFSTVSLSGSLLTMGDTW